MEEGTLEAFCCAFTLPVASDREGPERATFEEFPAAVDIEVPGRIAFEAFV